MNRRGFLSGILAAGAAPWVCTTAGVLMPVKPSLGAIDIIPWQGEMTATEVLRRQQEYLDRVRDLVWVDMKVNPPLIAHGGGFFTVLNVPDRPWFSLSLKGGKS